MSRRSRSLSLLLGMLVASCEAGGPGDALPELRDGFTYLKTVHGVIRNASMEGFNVDATGLAVSGDRVAAIVMVGQFFQTFTVSPRFDAASGSYVSDLGGGTSTNTWFTFHLSEDGGATWSEVPLAPARDAPTGWTTGLVIAGDRYFTTVNGGRGRSVVEIDAETGVYREVDIRYEDGGRWQPSFFHSRVFGSTVVSVEVPPDFGQIRAWRADLATGDARAFVDEEPACSPLGVVTGGARPELFGVSSSDTIQGICTATDDRICWFTWRLGDDAPGTTPMEIRRCAPRDDFMHPAALSMDGVVPDVSPISVLFTPAGLHVVAEAEYVAEGRERIWRRAVALSFRDDGGPPDAIDLGPASVDPPDYLSLHPMHGGLARLSPLCGTTVGATGECSDGPTGDHGNVRLVGWDLEADAFGVIRMTPPSPCVDSSSCTATPHRLVRAGDGRYLGVWAVSRGGLEGEVERGIAIGFVHAPWYEPPAPLPEPGPVTPGSATPLEMHCWAEIACDREVALGQSPETIRARYEQCFERWAWTVRGAPDALWETFVGTALDDCDGLRAADPIGFLDRSECPAGTCDPSGDVACGTLEHCGHLNGGSCSVVAGSAGCFADACPDGATGEPHCDASGRWVECWQGRVDDCASRGLVCVEGNGCLSGVPECADAGGSRCDGAVATVCLGAGVGRRVDCSREGATCDPDFGCVRASVPPELLEPRCEGERLHRDGRITDCAALGLRCFAPEIAGLAICMP